MNTQDYLKIAVDNLRLASQARKIELDELRRAVDQKADTVKDQLNEMRKREASSLDNAAETDDDKNRAEEMRDAQRLRAEESKVKSEYDKYKRDLDTTIAAKQRNYDDINKTLQDMKDWQNI